MGARPSRYAKPPHGRTKVWCSGRCMTGPDYRGTLLTLILSVTLLATSLGVAFPYLLTNHLTIAIPLLLSLLISLGLASFAAFLVATTDPGIIPRSDTLPSSIVAFPAVRERKIVFRGRPVTLRFCDTCKIWRPPRTSHCATCNNCVRRFDHHCPWLGNDIGIRNYRSYFAFVVTATVAAGTAITASALAIHFRVESFRNDATHAGSIRKALSTGATSVNIVLIVLCFLVLLFTAGLTGFHLYLMWNNVTTAESFKKRARNSADEDDDLRGFAAIWRLQGSRRPHSCVTDGYIGERYPYEAEFIKLVNEQVEMEKAVSVPGRVAPMRQI